jgi:predicted TIM-barrel enzyme
MRGDAVIVTGAVTGDAPQIADVASAKKHCGLLVYLGSGVTAKNLTKFYAVADGFIVGSEIKEDGIWSRPVDPVRVKKFMAAHRKLGG